MTRPAIPGGAAAFTPQKIVPTDEQRAIQTCTQRSIVIEANAGAAKTTTLALRVAEALQRGVAPEAILVLTFTGPACAAFGAALKTLGLSYALARRLRIHTIDDFAATVLQRFEGGAVQSLLSAESLKPHVLQAMHAVEDDANERWRDELVFVHSGDAAVEDFLAQALRLKGTLLLDLHTDGGPITPELANDLGQDYALLKTLRAYERRRQGGHPDHPVFRGPFDATYDLAQRLLQHQIGSGDAGWPSGLRLLVVDEMHDLNQAMFTLLQALLLSHPAAFFCGAGDRDQVIHQLAGADVRFMLDEIQISTGRALQRMPLTASFRFGPALARAAGALANKPYASCSGAETRIELHGFASSLHCAELVLGQVLAWRATQGVRKMNQLAILLRHEHQSIEIENALLGAGVAYTTLGLESYLWRPEILLVRGLLAVARGDFRQLQDPRTRQRVLEAFIFFGDIRITERDADAALDQHSARRRAIEAVVEHPDLLHTFFENQVLRNAQPEVRTALQAAAVVAAGDDGADMLARLFSALRPRMLAGRVLVEQHRLREVEGNLRGLLASAAGFSDATGFFEHLNQAELRQASLRSSHSLRLASVEAVKGLEFDHVLLPHLTRHEFPDAQSAAQDERNLFYVGITRARRQLTLLASAESPSRFIADAGWTLPVKGAPPAAPQGRA